MVTTKRLVSLCSFAMLLALPVLASAAEVIQLADNSGAQKRFMSLDSVRNGTAQARGIVNKSSTLRSDRAALDNGFMLIDRGHAVPIPLQHALATPEKKSSTTVTSAPQVIRGVTQSGAAPPVRIWIIALA